MEFGFQRMRVKKLFYIAGVTPVFIYLAALLLSIGEAEAATVCVEGPTTSFTKINTGYYHTCGLTGDGQAYCWGSDEFGQLGDGNNPVDDCGGVQCSHTPLGVDTTTTGGKAFVQVVGARMATCGLTGDGLAYCWGKDTYGELGDGDLPIDVCGVSPCAHEPVPVDTSLIGAPAFVQLTAGYFHFCGLTGDGLVYCWGEDLHAQLGNGAAPIDDCNAIPCSLRPVAVDTTSIGGKKFVHLSAGNYSVCALTGDGEAYCWGDNQYGQTGTGGAPSVVDVPTQVDTSGIGNVPFAKLESGGYHTCALTGDGIPYCWGRDEWGALCDGGGSLDTQFPGPMDVSVIGNEPLAEIEPGLFHTCVLTGDGTAYCCGEDFLGELGNGTAPVGDCAGTPCSQTLVPLDTVPTGGRPILHISAGFAHSCALIAGGTAFCWGWEEFGQLGEGPGSPDMCDTFPCAISPQLVDTASVTGSKTFVQLAAGNYTGCGLDEEGVPYCWGEDLYGELGDGGGFGDDSKSPVAVDTSGISGESSFVQVVGGGSFSCGLTADGIAYCWGRDDSGQLGDGGTSNDSIVPVPVDTVPTGGVPFVRLAAGITTVCGLTVEGIAYCWGSDSVYQLGDGAGSPDDCSGTPCSQSPTLVDTTNTGGVPFVQLAPGLFHACGLTADGTAYCWGSDGYGQIGNDFPLSSSTIPVAVDASFIPGEKTFVQLVAGGYHTCGLTSDGIVYCWGRDNMAALGDGGVSSDSPVPVGVDINPISGETTFVHLTSKVEHVCGITSEGVVYCWGEDWQGQLGDGNNPIDDCAGIPCSQSPVILDTAPISGETTFVQLVGGAAFSCGLTSENVAYCWGHDHTGQLGDGGVFANTQSPSAVGGCDDGVYCNGLDDCDGLGGCNVHPGDPCLGGSECNNFCNELPAGDCRVAAGTPCADTTPDDCKAAQCNGLGGCSQTFADQSDGAQCDDIDDCSTLDSCQGGVCIAGPTNKDTDGDTYFDFSCPGGTDCDDSLNFVNPGASEGPTGDATCADTHDNDCNSLVDMNDPGCIECQFDTDCDDTNVCTNDSCAGGVCQNIGVPDGQACDDGVYCTEPDTCQAGTCGGQPRDCSGVADACNDGVCNESQAQCQTQPAREGNPCDDGQYCTLPDTCLTGSCIGPTRACDDQDSCTTDSCDEANDRCDSQLTPIPGAEGPRGDLTCSDGIDNDCDQLTDGFDPECVLCANDGQCDDQNTCTVNTCVAQQCVTAGVPDDTPCDDGLHCTAGDSCQSGVCSGGDQFDCSNLDDDCNTGICNETTDSCEADPGPKNGDACEDGDLCTENDTCQGGGCVNGPRIDCTGSDGECVYGDCVDGRCDVFSMGAGVICAGCYRCLTSAAGTVCTWSSNLPARRCLEGECRIPMVRCDDDNNCVIEGICDQAVEGCGIPVVYGKGPGQTLECRLPEGKVGVKVEMEPASGGVGTFLPVRVHLTNTPTGGWSKCIYGLQLVIELNPEGEHRPGGRVAYVRRSALLQGGGVAVEEEVDEQNQRVVVVTLGGEDDCLPAPGDGGQWVLDFLLVRGTFEDGWFKVNVWAPCVSSNEVMGCHAAVDGGEEHRVSGTLFSYTTGKSFKEGEDSGQMLHSYTLGCQCGTGENVGGLLALGILFLILLRTRANYLKRANRDVTHRFEA